MTRTIIIDTFVVSIKLAMKLQTRNVIDRKKVMALASSIYECRGSIKLSYSFIEKHYENLFSVDVLFHLATKIVRVSTWGQAQTIAWNMAKYQVRKRIEFAKAILQDKEFVRSKGTIYNERVENWNPSFLQRRCPTEEVIYTEKFGRLVLSDPLIKFYIRQYTQA